MAKEISRDIICCPTCKSDLSDFETHTRVCNSCGTTYEYINGKFMFVRCYDNDVNDGLDRVKYFFKSHFKELYNVLIVIISPVYIGNGTNKFIKKHVEGKNKIAVNLGSGSSNLSAEISNVDIFAYESVDLTCDINSLPFKDNSIDVILNLAVLEHVPSPDTVISEIYRILKKDGLVYCFFPFIQGFHASPYDYSRRTYEGIKESFKQFEILEVKNGGGPTSGFLWVFQEWTAMLLSFGIKPLYNIIYIIVMLLTFPLKFLDILLIHHPMAKNISSGFYVLGRKCDQNMYENSHKL